VTEAQKAAWREEHEAWLRRRADEKQAARREAAMAREQEELDRGDREWEAALAREIAEDGG
jgi:hypothetical protein